MEIDAVYTWVNALDPAWRAPYEKFSALELGPRSSRDAATVGSIRHTDHNELRYSLRSLERYAPFFRRIHIVVDGAPPEWLDTSSPEIHIVGHREIFPSDYRLPVFSSNLIEAFLWRIPDLAERYVYFNDDMLLGARCTEHDFFDEQGRAVVRMLPELIHTPRDSHDRIYYQVLRNTERGIRKRLTLTHPPRFTTRKPWVPMFLRRILLGRLSLNMMVHIAQPFQRALWPTCLEIFRRELTIQGMSRFRHRRGFWLNLAYQYLARERGTAVFDYELSDMVIGRRQAFADPEMHKARLRAAEQKGIKFLCLNDGYDTSGGDWDRFIEEALSEMLGAPSRWEKACASSPPPAPEASAP
jgi:stealth protein CR2/Stealth-like protein